MFIGRLISEFGEYHYTSDYLRGVLVEMTGILIEVLLLSITVPTILYFVRRARTRSIRFMVDFYLFQIFHKITRMFLRMASIDDVWPILVEELNRNPKFKIFSHFVYGNLENILFVLKKTFVQGDMFRAEVEKRSLAEFKEFRDIPDRCIEEIDRLAAMLSSVPNIQEELFTMRMLVYPLRDLYSEVIEDIQVAEKAPFLRNRHSRDVQRQAEQLTKAIDAIFTKRRKLIDSMRKRRQRRSHARLVLSLPYIIVRRWIERRLCRLRRKPYRDFFAPSSVPDGLQDWRRRRGMTLQQAAATLGIPQKDYYDYEQGYREPPWATWENIKLHLRMTDPADGSKPQTETLL